MEQQHEQPVTTPREDPSQPSRQPWQRPTLQRLHVSLDTANTPGSQSDAETETVKN